MKGNSELVQALRARAREELSAVHQYLGMSALCHYWGYQTLAAEFARYAQQEHHHAEELLQRIAFLEGSVHLPEVDEFPDTTTVPDMLQAFHDAELDAIQKYNATAAQAEQAGDYGTADLMRHILSEEEMHLQWVEALLVQMQHMGLDNLLSVLVGATDDE